ncbi:helix-turn-helix domain-containing protein [Streptomyces sp. NPDC053560]|uniref:PucR family transcriptional regulator n=1 Tax=Streptomyces sp. NPDC053560 TaxID=3365711 RepID=UPI0037CF6893
MPRRRPYALRGDRGPLLNTGSSSVALLRALEAFLTHDGSWARTADALHLHVNTVHYRIERVEHFTGRNLSSLRDRLDLWAALLCRTPEPSTTSATPARRARASASPARWPDSLPPPRRGSLRRGRCGRSSTSPARWPPCRPPAPALPRPLA